VGSLVLICGVVGIVVAAASVVLVRRAAARRSDVDVDSFLANLRRVDGEPEPAPDAIVVLPAPPVVMPAETPRSAAAAS
jgi:hypothetical protein